MTRLPVPRTAFLLRTLASCLVIQGALAGCSKQPTERVGRPYDTLQLTIGDASVVAEVASDDPSRRLGLMNRESLPEDRGMLFIFRSVRPQSFWMKNTLIPLSIAFISDDGEILQIEHMKPKDLSSTRSKQQVRYALEVNKGWFERHGITPGDRIQDFRKKVGIFKAS